MSKSPAKQNDHTGIESIPTISDGALNDKFYSLIKKIEKNNNDKEAKGEEKDDDEQTYNKDRALKELYDESVDFKNTLAALRSNIKQLSSQFNAYDVKCNSLIQGEFDEYRNLRTKIEDEKKRIEESNTLNDKRMEERSNRLKVMQIEFLK